MKLLVIKYNSKKGMNDELKVYIEMVIRDVFKGLDLTPTVTIKQEGAQYRLIVGVENGEIFKKYNYDFLYCMQYYLRVVTHKKFPQDKTHFLLDINNMRSNRETAITSVIPDMVVKEVVEGGVPLILIGLSSYERKLLHTKYVGIKGVNTRSVGEIPNRRFVIEPTSEVGVAGLESGKVVEIQRLVDKMNS